MEEIVIAGEKKLVEDFYDVFSKLLSVRIENSDELTEFISNNCGNAVLCFYDEEQMINRMGCKGFLYRKDFYVASDFFFLLDFKDKKEPLNSVLFNELYFWVNGDRENCDHTLYEAEIKSDGEVYLCCSARLPYSIGNIYELSFVDIWKSIRATIIRRSTQNGSSCFCRNGSCQELKNREPDVGSIKRVVTLSDFPLNLNVAIDDECNLHCSMCRNSVQLTSKIEIEKRQYLVDVIEREVLENCVNLYVAGDGEFFFSRIYNELFERICKRKEKYSATLILLTNGNLFDGDKVKKLSDIFSAVDVMVSIDAATEYTYNKIRRGGKFKNVLSTLDELKKLKKEKIIRKTGIRFVIQKSNYMEIMPFIKLGEENNVDFIDMTRLVMSESMTTEEFQEESLLDEHGILKEEYKNWFKSNKITNNYVRLDDAFQ